MIKNSSKISQLHSNWSQLHDLDRAKAVANLRRSGISIRSIARQLGCSESLLRHLLLALRAPAVDLAAARNGDQQTVDPNSVRSQARDALAKAIELDPDLAEAHSSIGWYKMWFDWDSPGAERELLRGIELSPNNSSAHRYYAFYLRIRGRLDEALEQNSRAMELSPLDILPQAHLAGIHLARGEQDKVMEQANRVLEIDPGFTGVYMAMTAVYEARHQWPRLMPLLST